MLLEFTGIHELSRKYCNVRSQSSSSGVILGLTSKRCRFRATMTSCERLSGESEERRADFAAPATLKTLSDEEDTAGAESRAAASGRIVSTSGFVVASLLFVQNSFAVGTATTGWNRAQDVCGVLRAHASTCRNEKLRRRACLFRLRCCSTTTTTDDRRHRNRSHRHLRMPILPDRDDTLQMIERHIGTAASIE
jgi:hypothetical protein